MIHASLQHDSADTGACKLQAPNLPKPNGDNLRPPRSPVPGDQTGPHNARHLLCRPQIPSSAPQSFRTDRMLKLVHNFSSRALRLLLYRCMSKAGTLQHMSIQSAPRWANQPVPKARRLPSQVPQLTGLRVSVLAAVTSLPSSSSIPGSVPALHAALGCSQFCPGSDGCKPVTQGGYEVSNGRGIALPSQIFVTIRIRLIPIIQHCSTAQL